MSDWTFLSNHAYVLVCVASDPQMRLREIADRVGITERAAHRIVVELEASGYLTRSRVGARNAYQVHVDRPLRHPLERDRAIGDVLRAIMAEPAAAPAPSSAA